MPCMRDKHCFLDVASINQSDETLKERGIYGLGGFLKASKELRIMWSPPYLSRHLNYPGTSLLSQPLVRFVSGILGNLKT